jgi:hypothetical protein
LFRAPAVAATDHERLASNWQPGIALREPPLPPRLLDAAGEQEDIRRPFA